MSHEQAKLINLAGLYQAQADPRDLMRVNAGEINGGLFDTMPILSQYADTLIYGFHNGYDVNTTNVWIEGNIGSGTGLAIGDGKGGFATFVTAAADNDFYQYTSYREQAKIAAGKDLWFFGCIKVSEATQIDWFFGLSARINTGTVDATHNIFDAGAGNKYDAIGFRKDDGDTQIDFECRKNGTATSSTNAMTCAAATTLYLGFHVKQGIQVAPFCGTSLQSLAYVSSLVTNIPDDEELAVIFGARNGDGNARTMTVYPIWVIMDKD
jgi:hypothetical protein